MTPPSASVTNAGTVTLATRLRARTRTSGWAAGISGPVREPDGFRPPPDDPPDSRTRPLAPTQLVGALDRRGRAVGPRVAVPEQQVRRRDPGEAIDRAERLLGGRVERRRH